MMNLRVGRTGAVSSLPEPFVIVTFERVVSRACNVASIGRLPDYPSGIASSPLPRFQRYSRSLLVSGRRKGHASWILIRRGA